MATTGGSSEVTRSKNPAPGAVLPAPAGGHVEADFDFENSAPFVAAFHIEVEGLPGPEWASGIGEAAQTMAAAYGGGTLTVRLSPPASASPADYALRVKIISEGAVVDGGDIPLTLRVEPGLPGAAPTLAEPEPAVAEAVIKVRPDVADKADATGTSARADGTAAALEPPPPVPEAASLEAATPEVREPPEPDTRTREPEPELPVAEAPDSEPEPPVVEAPPSRPVRAEPAREVAKAVPIKPVKAAKPAPPATPPRPVEEELQVVEVPEEEEEPEEEAPPEEGRQLVDPLDGMSIPIPPGESILVKFNIHNEGRQERTFVVEEDRSLPSDWISLVQDRVNITHNAVGQVMVRVKPPANAEPGGYPFQLRTGPQGGILTPCNLVLQVLPTPAVALTAKDAVVRVGPFGRAVNFQLTASSAGNADTAFRISVKAPLAEQESGQASGPTDIYETPEWRYLFDRELENLESPADRPPTPKPIRLQLWRKGTWWLGLRERHRVKVAAVPVLDPTNGGKPGNSVELTAVRWRILPLPGFLALPLLFLVLVLLTSGAQEVSVTNAMSVGESWYVVQQKPQNPQEGVEVGKMAAHLSWNAPWYALLNLDATDPAQTFRFVHGEFDTPLQVKPLGSSRTFNVHPMLLGRGQLVNVTYVPVWTVGKLQIAVGAPVERVVTPAGAEEKIGADEVPVQGATIGVRVPRSRYVPITLANLTQRGGAGGRNIRLWLVKKPSADQFETRDLKDQYEIPPGTQEVPIKLKALSSQPESGQELVFLTTDAHAQLLRVKLEGGQ